MYTITEKIHHGDYIAVNAVTGSEPEAFMRLVEESPYYSNMSRDRRRELFGDLMHTGTATFGWATYTLTETDD